MDAGNAQFAGQESLIVFEDVFVPHEHVFMDGEWEYASSLVERFTTYHRSSYVCKTGLGDVLIGAAASAAEHNGVEAASHIKDKLVDASQRDDLFKLHGGRAPVEAGGIRRLYQRRDAIERRKAQRDKVSVRDRAARAGHRRRPRRYHAVGEGLAEQRSR